MNFTIEKQSFYTGDGKFYAVRRRPAHREYLRSDGCWYTNTNENSFFESVEDLLFVAGYKIVEREQHTIPLEIKGFGGYSDGKHADTFYCVRKKTQIVNNFQYLQKDGYWHDTCGDNGFFESEEEIHKLLGSDNELETEDKKLSDDEVKLLTTLFKKFLINTK
jgi:hypothetical protein